MPLHLRLLLPALTLALGVATGFIQPLGLLLGTAFATLLLVGQRPLPSGLWLGLVLLGRSAPMRRPIACACLGTNCCWP